MSLMQIRQDGFFPADLLFLASTNPDGVCYIEVHFFHLNTNLSPLVLISLVFYPICSF